MPTVGGKAFAPAQSTRKPPPKVAQAEQAGQAPEADPLLEMQALYGNQAMLSFMGEQEIEEAVGKQPEGPKYAGPQPEPAPEPKLDPARNPDSESEHVKGAEYTEVTGQAFVKGQGDTNDIAHNDVSQGQLGDCYFMAALAALAHTNPELIRSRVKSNGDGTYTVSFKEGGDVVVDGKFPTKGGDVQFAGKGDEDPKQGAELWVMLIEKAWAKLKGGYEVIRGSKVRMTSTDAMEAVAGGESVSKNPGSMNDEQLFAALGQAQDNKWAATLGVKNLTNADEVKACKEKGLVPNHAYAVLNVDMKNKTVEVYNPWGAEYTVAPLTGETIRKYVNVLHINKQAAKKQS